MNVQIDTWKPHPWRTNTGALQSEIVLCGCRMYVEALPVERDLDHQQLYSSGSAVDRYMHATDCREPMTTIMIGNREYYLFAYPVEESEPRSKAKLDKWGVEVSVINGELHSVSLSSNDKDPSPVELVCVHFLRDVNAAIGTHFKARDFPIRSCEGHH